MDAAVQPGPARLVIRACGAAAPPPGALQRLRSLVGGAAPRGPVDTLRLHIDDLRGRCLLVVDDAGPLVDVPLPPGTYHVFAGMASLQRCYTMTLEPGLAFTLVLSFDA